MSRQIVGQRVIVEKDFVCYTIIYSNGEAESPYLRRPISEQAALQTTNHSSASVYSMMQQLVNLASDAQPQEKWFIRSDGSYMPAVASLISLLLRREASVAVQDNSTGEYYSLITHSIEPTHVVKEPPTADPC